MASEQWLAAGGECLPPSAWAEGSRRQFELSQRALAIDLACARLKASLTALNSPPLPHPPRLPTKKRRNVPDDQSDGSEVQAALIARNVRPGKPERQLSAGSHTAPDGSLRLVLPSLLSPQESEQLVAGGVLAMAGAFSRCGQTTLGLSPALAARTSFPHSSEAFSSVGRVEATVPLLYRSVERARRAVGRAFGVEAKGLRTSDATLTRLQPVSVQEYEYSALLYLVSEGEAFMGGRLVFHDEGTDCVVLPRQGMLVAFKSAVPNLHAVEQENVASAALCSLPANDPLCQALLLARANDISQVIPTLALGLALPVESAHAAPAGLDEENLAEESHPLLVGRVRTLRALKTTLGRACAQRGMSDAANPN
ncbi:MAG: hypothetical protein SGPRY_006728, partial [Prymnesium sp.]